MIKKMNAYKVSFKLIDRDNTANQEYLEDYIRNHNVLKGMKDLIVEKTVAFDPDTITKEELEKLVISELWEIAHSFGLRCDGTKKDLVARIMSHVTFVKDLDKRFETQKAKEVSLEWLSKSEDELAKTFRQYASRTPQKECSLCAMFFEDKGFYFDEIDESELDHFQQIANAGNIAIKIVRLNEK